MTGVFEDDYKLASTKRARGSSECEKRLGKRDPSGQSQTGLSVFLVLISSEWWFTKLVVL